ncbi:hypothetical protein ACTHGU_01995 [Chitinophagaceae bacterium MMS25-I14]
MALDFHRLDNNDFLFGLDDGQYNYLSGIFKSFEMWTGLAIDQYSDLVLVTTNQELLMKIIDKHIVATNLNYDKKRTDAILTFKGLINFCVNHKIDLKLRGD